MEDCRSFRRLRPGTQFIRVKDTIRHEFSELYAPVLRKIQPVVGGWNAVQEDSGELLTIQDDEDVIRI